MKPRPGVNIDFPFFILSPTAKARVSTNWCPMQQCLKEKKKKKIMAYDSVFPEFNKDRGGAAEIPLRHILGASHSNKYRVLFFNN